MIDHEFQKQRFDEWRAPETKEQESKINAGDIKEALPVPNIERLNSGYKLQYHYSDGEEIEVSKQGYDDSGAVYIVHKTPDGRIEKSTFDRTDRDTRRLLKIRNPEELKEFVKDKNLGQVLDVGTGSGKFVNELRDAGVDARGLDIWLDHKQIESGNFILASAHKTGLPDNSMDTIFINTFMHYGMDNEFRQKILKELTRILRPEGRILMSIPMRGRKEFYESVLADLKLEINDLSEFSETASRGQLGYTEIRKKAGQEK